MIFYKLTDFYTNRPFAHFSSSFSFLNSCVWSLPLAPFRVMWQPAVSVPSAVWCEKCPLLSVLLRKGWVCKQVLAQVKNTATWASRDSNDGSDLLDQMAHCHHRFLHSVCFDQCLSAADPHSLQDLYFVLNRTTGVFKLICSKRRRNRSWIQPVSPVIKQ